MKRNTPAITVSSLDLERIEQLLEVSPHRDYAGAESLRTELSRATIVAPEEMPRDVVTMNSTAVVEDEATGEKRELTLVYPRDVDGSPGKVSVFAPVGSAMLGLRVGQSIDWQVPGGRRLRLRVMSISYQPEAGGELHR